MATNILMPALSPTMTEGTLARWLKKEGEPIKAGDVIAEIETDKATMEVEAVDEGVLGKILVADGTAGVKVNEPIAVLVETARRCRPAPRRRRRSPRRRPQPAPPPPAAPRRRRRAGAGRAGANGHAAAGERIFASPLARRMAKQAGIDLSGAEGQRPERADRAGRYRGGAEGRRAPAAAAAPAPAAGTRRGARCQGARRRSITAPHKLVPHSSMRKVIARRLTEAKSTIPHFYVSMDIEIDALLELHDAAERQVADGGRRARICITINDLVIKAAGGDAAPRARR